MKLSATDILRIIWFGRWSHSSNEGSALHSAVVWRRWTRRFGFCGQWFVASSAADAFFAEAPTFVAIDASNDRAKSRLTREGLVIVSGNGQERWTFQRGQFQWIGWAAIPREFALNMSILAALCLIVRDLLRQ